MYAVDEGVLAQRDLVAGDRQAQGGEPLEQHPIDNPQLDARELLAEALVDAKAEGHVVARVGAVELERVRIGELVRTRLMAP